MIYGIQEHPLVGRGETAHMFLTCAWLPLGLAFLPSINKSATGKEGLLEALKASELPKFEAKLVKIIIGE